MDVKKSPNASLEDKKLMFVMMGLVMVLSLTYIAFEWTQREVTVYEADNTALLAEEEIEIVQTAQELPPPPPPPAPEIVEIINVVENDVEVATVEINTEDDKDKGVEISAPVSVSTVVEEEDQVIFQVVEQMPSFPDGQPALFKFLNENVKYPPVAAENGVQGRVICQFVVNKDGSIVDVEVVRSVDPSLDKEAIRVIKSMPKWTPGLQRGKPVRVKYTLPVNFKLQ
mgnify:FL=1|jgi:protein TonB